MNLPNPYAGFLPQPLLAALAASAEPVVGVAGLSATAGLQATFPALESADVLGAVVDVYRAVVHRLDAVLRQRERDRAFIDDYALSAQTRNVGKHVRDPDYDTVVGQRDQQNRVVVGPLPRGEQPAVNVPDWLAGPQITLFGPPDSARLAINAMNALHRKPPNEPALVADLVAAANTVPRWGADSEDSKTPLGPDLLSSSLNLAACFNGSLSFTDARSGKGYVIADSGRSLPIKRVAGLALPDGNHLLDGVPLPLHLIEFVQHAWLNHRDPKALVYYLPKLENEEEAGYIAELVRATESALGRCGRPLAGTIRLLLVFENPRAIFRIQEMAAALHPYFVGGSLGWHDYLASTARLFRNDPGYRIPVKADPQIVIRNIRESHGILVRDLGALEALKIGGMYGVLPTDGDAQSYAVSIVGFIRDVVTQLKRGLDGFWVAHPDFVRIGIALVQAWKEGVPRFEALASVLVPDPVEFAPLRAFIRAPDISGLSQADPRYLRAVLAAESGGSDLIANHDPAEIRYNIFQALQYLADWLCGNGCVALPATIKSASGEAVFVRVMDDLATTERSRWELWAEVAHGRVTVAAFDAILEEEVAFIRNGVVTNIKRTQVVWAGEAARWYPIAIAVLRQLVVTKHPPEFVTELLMPFTYPVIREAPDPWAVAMQLCPERFSERVVAQTSGSG